MRVLKLSTLPSSYTSQLLSKLNQKDRSWAGLTNAIFCDFFGPVDSWQYWLRELGVDATDVLYGTPAVDAAWCVENGQEIAAGDDVAIGIARSMEPDIIVIQGFERVLPTFVRALRDAVSNVRIVGFAGVDIRTRPQLDEIDMLFSCMRENIDFVTKRGGRAQLLRHAFDERILTRLKLEQKKICATFIGSLESGAHLHDERRRILHKVCGIAPVHMYTAPEQPLLESISRTAKLVGARTIANMASIIPKWINLNRLSVIEQAANWPSFPTIIRKSIRPLVRLDPVFGLEMYRALGESLIVLNSHVGMTKYAANLRLFEATGMGTCLVTDDKQGLSDLFNDDEIVIYKTAEEAADKIRMLLTNPSLAIEIGRRAQARVMRDHSSRRRMEEVVKSLLRLFS